MQQGNPGGQATVFLTGALLVATGSALALWLPEGLAVALALGLTLRICWLEDNIRSDLIHAPDLPEGYRSTQALQRRLQGVFLGVASDPVTCPRRLASTMRVHSHALYAGLYAGTAAFLAKAAAMPVLGLSLGAVFLVLAFLRLDRIAEAEAILDTGDPLPPEMLENRGAIARFVVNR